MTAPVTGQGGRGRLKVSLEGRGGLVRLRTEGNPQRGGGKRGNVGPFSKASRKRLYESCAQLVSADFRRGLFLTLTYVSNMQDPVKSDRHLEEFCRRIWELYGAMAMVWRRERQKRGAIHYHGLIVGRLKWIPKRQVQAVWGSVIGERRPFTRISAVRSRFEAMKYIAKYMVKVDDDGRTEGGPGRGAASAAACPGSSPLGLKAVDVTYSRGRHWGIKGRKYLTEGIVVVGAGSTSPKQLERVRVFARAIWKGVGRVDGFSLFVENGPEMANLFCLGLGLRVQVCHSKGEVIAMWLRFMQEESNVQFNGEKTDGVMVA